jgi:hypothetical protein
MKAGNPDQGADLKRIAGSRRISGSAERDFEVAHIYLTDIQLSPMNILIIPEARFRAVSVSKLLNAAVLL